MKRPIMGARVPLVVAALVVASVVGCGGSDFGAVPVSGTVKYSDGTIPKGEINTITFQRVTEGQDGKGASGEIQEDGSFKLTSVDPDDGALPGEYVVLVTILESYVENKTGVAAEYMDPDDTPLKATVTAGGDNRFDFVIERP